MTLRRIGFGVDVAHRYGVGVAPGPSTETPSAQSFTVGTGDQEFETAPWFVGTSLVYSLVSPPVGVAINAVTGVCTVATVAILTLTNLVIRAANGLGQFDITIQVEVVI